jgi:cation transport regulator ChaB
MPYRSTSDLPPAVKARTKGTRRRQFKNVFNSIIKAHPGNESRAFAGAWSAVKRAGGVSGSRSK